jgi:hypothetical protein
MMDSQQAIRILTPQFWSIGKSNGEQLWMHHYTVRHIFRKMMEIGALPSLGKEEEILEVACLLHDLKKKTPWNQLILFHEKNTDKIVDSYVCWWQERGVIIDEKEKNKVKKLFADGRTDHQIETDRDVEYFLKPYLEFVKNELSFELTEENIRMIFEIIKHHFLKEEDISKAELPSFGNYIYILKLCDRLASMEKIDVNTINQLRGINELGRKIFDITFFTISRKFGPSTALLSDVIFEKYKQLGWLPLLYFEDGGVLITKGKGNIPDKEEILKEAYSSYWAKSLETMPVQYGRKTTFTGIAADHPKSFILAHRDEIQRRLDGRDAGVVFFKILTEILDIGGYNTKQVREGSPLLDILFGLTTGTRGIPLAQKKWKELKGDSLPLKEDGSGIDKRSSINHIFNSVHIEEIVPPSLNGSLPTRKGLFREFSAQELFDILLNVAGQCEKETDRDKRIKRYLDETISMEEEKDFRAIAMERFEQYKAYKLNPANERAGICEICGCTVTQKPGADFPKGQIQAFSQIKARADVPRKICPFCAYDNSVMRQSAGNWIPVYVKMGSRIPLEFRQDISERVIKPLKDGIIRVQNIEDMQKRWGILFPSVPVLIGESNYDVIDYVHTTDRTEIIARIETVNPKDFSPKDQKAKYEPLYHLLNLLGFRVSIGAEEQEGLFGEKIITTKEEYYKSLAVVLLADVIGHKGKKSKAYVFAQDIFNKVPSIAIRKAAERYGEDKCPIPKKSESSEMIKKNCKYFSTEQDKCNCLPYHFFKFAYKSETGGEKKLKGLLDNAVFFAEGIPKFCWTKKDWDKWYKDSSKHLITKPLSQTLNEILQGRQFEEAFARFLSHIREDIAKEKSDKAKTDVTELAEFVKEAKEKLLQFHELKNRNITEYIRVKNALLSAVYVFKRYENLKEVCK